MPLKSVGFAGFLLVLIAFWFTGEFFGITSKLGNVPGATVASFVLLLAPYWFFGWGLADPLKRSLNSPIRRITASAVFIVPYLVFSIPRGEFRVVLCAELLIAIVGLTVLLEYARGDWADYV